MLKVWENYALKLTPFTPSKFHSTIKINHHLHRIRKLGKQLINDFNQVSNTLLALGECYAGLYSAATNFNKTTEAGKNLHLEDIYLTMNNIMVAWGKPCKFYRE